MYMHINNRGWGASELIVMIAICFIAIAFIFYGTNKIINSYPAYFKSHVQNVDIEPYLNNDITNVPTEYYKSLENKLVDAAEEYVLINNLNLNESIVIQSSTLIDAGILNNLKDGVDNSCCSGYAVYSIYKTSAYINCSNYETSVD